MRVRRRRRREIEDAAYVRKRNLAAKRFVQGVLAFPVDDPTVPVGPIGPVGPSSPIGVCDFAHAGEIVHLVNGSFVCDNVGFQGWQWRQLTIP